MLVKSGQEYICSCFLRRNIFVKAYNFHVNYECPEQFYNQYRQYLRMRGCTTDHQYQGVLTEITKEIDRRKSLHQLVSERMQHFKDTYKRLHPNIWTLSEPLLDTDFLTIVRDAETKSPDELLGRIANHTNITEMEVFQFPVFTSDMCKLLTEEMDNFERAPGTKTRPNTMNGYGVSMDEMGLSQGLILPLIQQYLTPICAKLFPTWGGATIDSFKAFSVKYELGKDLKLSEHYDNAEVTININLSDEYEGGNIDFGGLFGEQVDQEDQEEKEVNRLQFEHKKGQGILHCGRRMHLAQHITQGSRTNLIIWMRSSAIRNSMCPMCSQSPTLIKVPASGEGFIPVSSWSSECVCV